MSRPKSANSSPVPAGVADTTRAGPSSGHPLDTVVETLHRVAMLVAGEFDPNEVFVAVAEGLLRHTNAAGVQLIRFDVDGSAVLLAGASAGLDGTRRPGRRNSDNGELSCAKGIPIHLDAKVWGMIEISTDGGTSSARVAHCVAEVWDLLLPAVAAAHQRVELKASRARLIAAADKAMIDIERRLQNQAQQRIIGATLRLRSTLPDANSGDSEETAAIFGELEGACRELQDIARRAHPRILAIGGLGTALAALARRSTVPVDLRVRVDGRLADDIEIAAYHIVAETLGNAAKHAHASSITVIAEADAHTLRLNIVDDGIGGANFAGGWGLCGLRDRADALDGTFIVQSRQGVGTDVSCELPLSLG